MAWDVKRGVGETAKDNLVLLHSVLPMLPQVSLAASKSYPAFSQYYSPPWVNAEVQVSPMQWDSEPLRGDEATRAPPSSLDNKF